MDSPKGLRLVEKAVEVVDQLAQHGELTVARLAEITGEPRSSLYRLVSSLESLGLVEAGSSRGQVRLGTKLIAWGAATQANLSVRERALPVMRDLNQVTELTVYLVVKRGDRGVCMERLEGVRVATLVLMLGGSLPLHQGAAPRALLAFGDESEWSTYVDTHLPQSAPSGEVISRSQFLDMLAAERKQGYTVSDEDVNTGIASIGVPIFGYLGNLEAALSISGIRDHVLGANKGRNLGLLLDAGQRISELMGAPRRIQ